MDYNLMVLMVFIGSLMNVFVLDRQVRVFFDKRRTSFPVFALSFLFYVVFINVSAWLAIPRSSMVVWVASRIVVSLNYEGTWKKRILAALLFTPIGLALEMGILLMYGVYFDHFLDRPLAHNFLTMTVTSLVFFMAALALQKLLANLKKNIVSSPAVLVSVFAFPLSSVALTLIFMVAADPSPLAAGFAGGIIFGTNVMVFWLLDRLSASGEARLQAALYARERKYYLEQCRMMQESMERTRSAQHDALTHLVALKGIADKNGDREAASYLDGLLADAGHGDPHSDTGNVVFDSVVNYKLRNADRDGVIPRIRLHRIPRELNVDASDLAAILGNLLDNALDAVARLDPGNRTVRLNAEFSRQALFIQVENPFDGELKYSGKPGRDGKRELATRKSGPDHGHGLRNIRRALEKYDGGLTVEVKGNVFSATALLYVSDGDATSQS